MVDSLCGTWEGDQLPQLLNDAVLMRKQRVELRDTPLGYLDTLNGFHGYQKTINAG